MVTDLVFLKSNTPITNSLVIAEGTDNEHRAVLKLIGKYEETLKRWGAVTFSHLKCGNNERDNRGRPTRIAYLNEPQATFLITLLKNTDIVVDFKAELVDQFYKMREILTRRQNEEWREARQLSATEFRKLTDTIRDVLIPQMEKEGASEAAKRWVYKNYVSMIQKILGIKKGTRNELPASLLYELGKVEDMTRVVIRGLVAAGTASKQIYGNAKIKIEGYAQLSLFNQRFLEG